MIHSVWPGPLLARQSALQVPHVPNGLIGAIGSRRISPRLSRSCTRITKSVIAMELFEKLDKLFADQLGMRTDVVSHLSVGTSCHKKPPGSPSKGIRIPYGSEDDHETLVQPEVTGE